MISGRRIDLVRSEGAWSGVDEHGVLVVTTSTRDEAIELIGRAGTSDLPITLRIHGADGVLEGERTFPAPRRPTCG